MNYPKISIVTPNLNCAQFLEETILSVLRQDYPNLQYIIVDGGSTDGSIDIIKKYDDQLSFWISEPDKGMYDAIQKGFEKCTGELMAWINSDDMYHLNAFFSVAEIFSTYQEVNWLVGASTNYDETGKIVDVGHSRQYTKFDFYNYDFKWIVQESVFWRRSLWEKAGSSLNVNLKYAGDFDLWVRFFQHERLFVTNALIGGFRLRRANQLSLEHGEEYLYEAKMLIEQTQLSANDKKVLQKYQKLLKIESFLKHLKFISQNIEN